MKKLTLTILTLYGLSMHAQSIAFGPINESKMTNSVSQALFLDDGTLAFAGPLTTGVNFIDLSSLEIRKSINCVQGHVDKFRFSPDRNWMIVTSFENEIMLWDLRANELKYTVGEYWPDYVTGKDMCFPPNVSTFDVFLGCDYVSWDIGSGLAVDTLHPMEDECMYVTAQPMDGSKVYACGNYHIWEFDKRGRKFANVMDVKSISVVTDIALHPNERQLAVAGREGMFLVGTDFTGRIDLIGHTDWIKDIAYSANGKFLYSTGGTLFGTDDTVRKWDTQTGKAIAVMEGHQNDVESLDISPNGKWVATASRDYTVRLWSTTEDRLVCTVVPMMVGGKLTAFYYLPSGEWYGPDEFFKLVVVRRDGEALSTEALNSLKSKEAVQAVLHLGK